MALPLCNVTLVPDKAPPATRVCWIAGTDAVANESLVNEA